VSLLVFVLAWMQPSVAGNPDRSKGDRAEQTDAIFAPLRSSSAPGAAVLVLKDGSTLFQRGYGVTDLRTRHRINAQTNFRLASVTKQFTAMAVMLLVHDGKVSYDDRLTDVFLTFLNTERGSPFATYSITLRVCKITRI
jgi:CubicO group peptidase (beta-lactamase class C family)